MDADNAAGRLQRRGYLAVAAKLSGGSVYGWTCFLAVERQDIDLTDCHAFTFRQDATLTDSVSSVESGTVGRVIASRRSV